MQGLVGDVDVSQRKAAFLQAQASDVSPAANDAHRRGVAATAADETATVGGDERTVTAGQGEGRTRSDDPDDSRTTPFDPGTTAPSPTAGGGSEPATPAQDAGVTTDPRRYKKGEFIAEGGFGKVHAATRVVGMCRNAECSAFKKTVDARGPCPVCNADLQEIELPELRAAKLLADSSKRKALQEELSTQARLADGSTGSSRAGSSHVGDVEGNLTSDGQRQLGSVDGGEAMVMPMYRVTLNDASAELRRQFDEGLIDEFVYYGVLSQWSRSLMQGLADVESEGLVHGDIKPANLMLDHNFELKIMDLGEAVEEGSAGAGATRRYASPEQLIGGGTPLTSKSDAYTAGRTVQAMAEGIENLEEERTNIIGKAPVKKDVFKKKAP